MVMQLELYSNCLSKHVVLSDDEFAMDLENVDNDVRDLNPVLYTCGHYILVGN